MTNQTLLRDLLEQNAVRIRGAALPGTELLPKSATFDFARVEGMLLGLAIGDALGAPYESMTPSERKARNGEIRDYGKNRYVNDGRGYPTDDTQLAFWTLEQLLKDKALIPDNAAWRFANSGPIFGLGRSVREFLVNYKKRGQRWQIAGPESAGNGALMRIAPVLLPHLRTGGSALWSDTVLAAMITHNDYASNSACVAFVGMLWELLDMSTPPDPEWWITRYVGLARGCEGETTYIPRGGRFTDYSGPVWRFAEERIAWAQSEKVATVEACDAWYSGAYLLETVPSALLILTRYAHDPEEAIVRAVNDTRDNDTIAAIVGACVGARHDRAALPARWVNNLSGWTRADDDGHVFELIQCAREVFWINDAEAERSLSPG